MAAMARRCGLRITRSDWPSGMALAALLVLLGGCASLSESECRQGDWRAIGAEDGRDGRDRARLGEHRQACVEYGIAPDEPAYLAGRDEGLRTYCTAGNGFRVGSAGSAYAGVCPPLLEGAFLHAFENGRELHGLRSAVEEVGRRIDEDERELRRVEDELRYLERAVNETQDADRRRDLVRDLRRLAEQRGRIRGELDALYGEHRLRSHRLDVFRDRLRDESAYLDLAVP